MKPTSVERELCELCAYKDFIIRSEGEEVIHCSDVKPCPGFKPLHTNR